MSVDDGTSGFETSRSSRRTFIRDAAVLGGTLAGAPALLTACGGGGGGTASSPGTTTAAAKAKRGGTLRVGVSGGSPADTLDHAKWGQQIDGARSSQLYDSLAYRDHDLKLVPMLGTEFTPNAAGDEMTVKLRSGVTFHDGKPLTADDVVYTFNRLTDAEVGAGPYALFNPVISRVEAVDSLTVRFKFKFPFNSFMDFAGDQASRGIIPVGYDPKRPIGTGPFKYKSFTPGQRSLFTRNENYWDVGSDGKPLPYVDAVEIIDLSEDAARVNALLSGAVDVIDSIPYALVGSVEENQNLQVLVSESGNWYPITMRVDRAPFDDARVREAFRWIVDRPDMVSKAYQGRARVSNDLYAIDDALYAADLPQRQQDIEKAKSLLKQAGREGLTVELVTAPIQAGVVESCVAFAEHAKAAGANVKISKLELTAFYNSEYLKRTFSVDWWNSFSFIADTAYTCGPTPTYNETHFRDERFNKLYFEVIGTQDPMVQKEIAHEMQEMLWNQGGYIIPGFPHLIDGYTKKVTGFTPNKLNNLDFWGFKNVWFV